jgi:hypothetical protein
MASGDSEDCTGKKTAERAGVDPWITTLVATVWPG